MGWLIYRVLTTALAVLVGGAAGIIVGHSFNAPLAGALLGCGAAAAALATFDGLRGLAIMDWLRGPQDGAAPRNAGFWGEVGYRVERSIRLLERCVDDERTRLSQFLSAI